MRPKPGYWQGPARYSGGALLFLCLVALVGYFVTPEDPNKTDVMRRLAGPSFSQWLGRDELGRDVLSRMLAGASVSLGVGTLAALLETLVGVVLGAWAGYKGGMLDSFIMRTADVLMCIPSLYLILTLIVILGPGLQNVVIVIVVTGWTGMARLVRAEVLTLKERDFVMASRASGASSWKILWKHILPNAMAPVYVNLTFGVSGAILMESGLSFLGLGVQAPQSSWGSILSSGREYISEAWWLVVFPGLMIFIAMLLVNHIGEEARKHFDPKEAA